MKVSIKSAPKKFEPKTIEITVETFEELKELNTDLKRYRGYDNTITGKLKRITCGLFNNALNNGEVDCDF